MKLKTEDVPVYDPDAYVEKEIEVGKQQQDTIVQVNPSTLKECIDEWDKYVAGCKGNPPKADQPVIEVITKEGAKRIMPLPAEKEFHPKSLLGRYNRTYKKLPAEGDKVKIVMDENGYWALYLVE